MALMLAETIGGYIQEQESFERLTQVLTMVQYDP